MSDDTRQTRSTAGDGDPPPVVELVLPERLGNYRLVRQIGRGGMGVVWLAHDDILDRPVAVKLLTKLPGGPHATQRLIDGTRAAAAVRAPGIVVVHHVDLYEGVPYLVMELVDGPSLGDLLRAGGPLPVHAAAWAFLGVCEAVASLHDEGVVHRDLKPSNVLIDRDRGPLVSDFGLAVAASGIDPSREFSLTPGMAGTPAYMAPECFDGVASPRSDTYALGVTLYELVAGRPPFEGDPDTVQALHQQAAFPPEPLRATRVPEPVIALIERAMHRTPRLRPRSPRHLADLLRAAIPVATIDSRGRDELVRLAWRPTAAETGGVSAPTPTSPGTYYDLLSVRAKSRRVRPDTPNVPEVPTPLTAAREANPWPSDPHRGETPTPKRPIRPGCPACGYDHYIISQGTACPECGARPTPLFERVDDLHAGSDPSAGVRQQQLVSFDPVLTPPMHPLAVRHAAATCRLLAAALAVGLTQLVAVGSLHLLRVLDAQSRLGNRPAAFILPAGLQAVSGVLFILAARRLAAARPHLETSGSGPGPIDDPRGLAWPIRVQTCSAAAAIATAAIAVALSLGGLAPRWTAAASDASLLVALLAASAASWTAARLADAAPGPRLAHRWIIVAASILISGPAATLGWALASIISDGASARGIITAFAVLGSLGCGVALVGGIVLALDQTTATPRTGAETRSGHSGSLREHGSSEP